MFNLTFANPLRSELLHSSATLFNIRWLIVLLVSTVLSLIIGYKYSQRSRVQYSASETRLEHPPAIDLEDNQSAAEHITSKCRIGREVWYMIKWKDFSSSENAWQRKGDIHPELVADFEAKLRRGRRHCQIIEPAS